MFRSIVAVVAGYAAMAILVMTLFAVLAAMDPDRFGAETAQAPGTGATLLILGFGCAAAWAGGRLTARIAPRKPWTHVLWLAGLVGLLSVASMAAGTGRGAPVWYQAGLLVVGVAGVLLGGRFRTARLDRAAAEA